MKRSFGTRISRLTGGLLKPRLSTYLLFILTLVASPLITGLSQTAYAGTPGSVRISEFMADPASVTDANGEWLELLNTTASGINMTGWTLDDGGATYTFGAVTIPANSKIVICKSGLLATNGGVVCDYTWAGMSLNNAGDTITLEDETALTINSLTYSSANVSAGESTIVNGGGGMSFETIYQYGAGDFGTPNGTPLLDTFDPEIISVFAFAGTHIRGNKVFQISAEDNGVVSGGINTTTDPPTMRIWNATNDSGEVTLTLDPSAPFNKYRTNYNTNALDDGVYQIDFYIADNAGNSVSITVNDVTVDNTDPTASLTSPTNGPVSGIVDIRGSGSDLNIAQYNILIYSGSIACNGTPNAANQVRLIQGSVSGNFVDTSLASWNTYNLPNGNYIIRMFVKDQAGNSSNGTKCARTALVTVNNVAPVVTVDTISSTTGSPAITGTVDNTSATIDLVINGLNYTATNNGDGTWTLPAGSITPDLTNGVYDVQATATDTLNSLTGNDTTVNELTVAIPPIVIPPITPPGPGPTGGSSNTDDSEGDDTSNVGIAGNFATIQPTNNATLGISDDTQTDEEDEESTDLSSSDTSQFGGEVQGASDDEGQSWFSKYWKWMLPLVFLLLLLFILARRRKDEEDK